MFLYRKSAGFTKSDLKGETDGPARHFSCKLMSARTPEPPLVGEALITGT